jgi:hypothetical protein
MEAQQHSRLAANSLAEATHISSSKPAWLLVSSIHSRWSLGSSVNSLSIGFAALWIDLVGAVRRTADLSDNSYGIEPSVSCRRTVSVRQVTYWPCPCRRSRRARAAWSSGPSIEAHGRPNNLFDAGCRRRRTTRSSAPHHRRELRALAGLLSPGREALWRLIRKKDQTARRPQDLGRVELLIARASSLKVGRDPE